MTPYTREQGRDQARRAYREDSLGWAFIGLLGLLAALGLLLDPHAAGGSAIDRELRGPLQTAWNVMWALGGATIIFGVLTIRPRTELIGELLFCIAVVIDAVAVATTPQHPVVGIVTAAIAAGFCGARVRFLARRLELRR